MSPLLGRDCVSSRPPSCPPSGSERSLLQSQQEMEAKGPSLSVEDRPAQGAGYVLRANICTVWAPLDQGLPVGILSLLLRSAAFRLPPRATDPGRDKGIHRRVTCPGSGPAQGDGSEEKDDNACHCPHPPGPQQGSIADPHYFLLRLLTDSLKF